MIIYLSGQMTGLPQYNYPAFHAAAARLRKQGYTVINPAEIKVENPSWENYLRADIKALMDCDAIVMLSGWENSRGAQLEKHIAKSLDMKVMHYESLLESLAIILQ